MAFPKKMQMPVAANERSNQDLSCQHVTTSDFMQFQLANAIEMAPNQELEISQETFTRLEALSVPTFGRAKVYNRVYFVPYRTVFPAWNDFFEEVPHAFSVNDSRILNNTPTLSNREFVYALCDSSMSTLVEGDARGDFNVVDTNNVVTKRKFTKKGRSIYKLLRTLGYGIVMNTNIQHPHALLPLKCALRVYIDFYFPSQYANTEDMLFALSVMETDTATSSIISSRELLRLFNIISSLCYDADYFTSAWDNPNSPNDGLFSDIRINDINTVTPSYANKIATDNSGNAEFYDGTPSIGNNYGTQGGSPSPITQFALNALRSMTDYMKRNQLVGSRVIDRYLARFGVTLTSDKLRRSYKVAEFSDNIQFGDVTSMADTDGAPLGDYAGKGVGFVDGTFKFHTDEVGMLIFVSTIIPQTKYYQGIARHTQHFTRTDFWTPEYDNLGTQAMSVAELYAPIDGDAVGTDYYNKVFGFVPRYAEYKVGRDMITGDYILNSMNVGKDSWTLFRDIKPYVDAVGGADNLVHDLDFVIGSDASQYNRIFYNTDDTADHFNVIHNFRIKSSFPGRGLFDTYEFKDEDKSRKVTMQVGGTTDN